jgi:DNA-directed RNA polymerase subunit M/transcription elongation factor TFIIS
MLSPVALELPCPNCGSQMYPEQAHNRCPSCLYIEPCCDGAPQRCSAERTAGEKQPLTAGLVVARADARQRDGRP